MVYGLPGSKNTLIGSTASTAPAAAGLAQLGVHIHLETHSGEKSIKHNQCDCIFSRPDLSKNTLIGSTAPAVAGNSAGRQ